MPESISTGPLFSGSVTNSGTYYRVFPVKNGEATFTVTTNASASSLYGATASVIVTATVLNRTAWMVTPDLDARYKDDGDLEADTVFSLSGIGVSDENLQHFEWGVAGPWSDYADQATWPHKDIRVDWEGSGGTLNSSHYTYTPIYDFDYSYDGCYFQREMETVSEGDTPIYETLPSNDDNLRLALTDLGDDFKFKQKLFLAIHYPADNWDEDNIHKVAIGPLHMIASMPCQAGKEIIINEVQSESTEVSFTIGVELPNIPHKLPFINVHPSFTGEFTRTVTSTHQLSVETGVNAPDRACQVDIWQRATMDRHNGTVTTWNKRGKISDNVHCHWDDPSSAVMSKGFTFFDTNMNLIPSSWDHLRWDA